MLFGCFDITKRFWKRLVPQTEQNVVYVRCATQEHEALARLLVKFAKINVLEFGLAGIETEGENDTENDTKGESKPQRYSLPSYLLR